MKNYMKNFLTKSVRATIVLLGEDEWLTCPNCRQEILESYKVCKCGKRIKF